MKLLIDSFSLFPCLCISMLGRNQKLKSKVVFILLIHTTTTIFKHTYKQTYSHTFSPLKKISLLKFLFLFYILEKCLFFYRHLCRGHQDFLDSVMGNFLIFITFFYIVYENF